MSFLERLTRLREEGKTCFFRTPPKNFQFQFGKSWFLKNVLFINDSWTPTKKEKKMLNLVLFNINMPKYAFLPPSLYSQIKKCLNLIQWGQHFLQTSVIKFRLNYLSEGGRPPMELNSKKRWGEGIMCFLHNEKKTSLKLTTSPLFTIFNDKANFLSTT